MRFKSVMTIMVLLAVLLSGGCGLHYEIQGQVVDAVTKQPVQGAVVAIEWYRIKWLSFMTSGHQTVATADAVTDANGMFTIPRYHHITTGGSNMGVYKEGYICWFNKEIFNPQGKGYGQVIPRKGLRVSDSMVVDLEPIKWKGFPVFEHAAFVNTTGTRVKSTKFSKATINESKYWSEEYRRRAGIKQ